MKRTIQTLVSAAVLALAFAACTNEALAPAEPSVLPVDGPTVSISLLEKADNSFSFQVVPAAGAAFYSYLVTTEPITSPDSSKVYSLGYDNILGKRVTTATSAKYTDYAREVDSNADYYVYAVAADASLNIGPVAMLTVGTPDTVSPEIVDFDYEENVLYLLFSEPVTYVESKEITAQVQAGNYPVGTPVIEKTKGAVAVQGKVAQITFDEIKVPGSIYVVNVPAGAFVDAVGLPTPAVSSSIEGVDEKGGIVFADGSLYGALENADLDYEIVEGDVIVDYSAYTPLIKTTQMLDKIQPKSLEVAIAHTESDRTVTTAIYNLQAPTYGAIDMYTVASCIPEEPARGDKITFTLAKESVQDIYGNTNSEEIVVGPFLYSYGFTIDDVLGTYVNAGTSGYGAAYDEDPWTMTIAADESGEGVVITSMFGVPSKLAANWDGDSGILTIPMNRNGDSMRPAFLGAFVDDGVYYEYYVAGYYNYFAGSTAVDSDIKLYMSEKGSFYSGNDFVGYIWYAYSVPEGGTVDDITEDNYLGYDYNIFRPVFTIVEESGVAPSSVKTYFPFPKGFRFEKNFSKTLVK